MKQWRAAIMGGRIAIRRFALCPQAMRSIAGGVGTPHGRRVLKITRHLKREIVPKDDNFSQKRIISPSAHKQCAALQGVWGSNAPPHKAGRCGAGD